MPFLLSIWQNKTARWVLLGLIGLVLFYVWARAAGKKKALEDAKQAPLPNNGSGIPVGWDPKPLANRLFEVMDGVTTSSMVKEPVFAETYGLSADQLTAVYNAFNLMFASKGDGTLTQWLRDERNYSLQGVKPQLIARLVSLNLL